MVPIGIGIFVEVVKLARSLLLSLPVSSTLDRDDNETRHRDERRTP
jgi:hypothetical protein